MLHTSTTTTEREKQLAILVICMVIIETILVTMALVPAQLWTRLLPRFDKRGIVWTLPANSCANCSSATLSYSYHCRFPLS